MLLVLALSFVLLILVIPVKVTGRTLTSADGLFLLNNFKIGLFPVFAVKVEIENGEIKWIYKKSPKPPNSEKPNQNNEKKQSENSETGESGKDNKKSSKKSEKNIELKQFSAIRIREVSASGYFGAEDASATAIITGGINIALMSLFASIPRAERYSVSILPRYGTSGLLINFRLSLQFNILIIIIIAINILLKGSRRGI
ncbi:MAG: hypothetical protein FWD49_04280 [Firmicutes bacterium]|nr:hypothetical protein [Bacillota bacterium]